MESGYSIENGGQPIMTNRRNDIEDAKDGFDLIEYPCEYVF